MGAVFIISGGLSLFWAIKEYNLLKEKDISQRQWGYFRRAKGALNRLTALLMVLALNVSGVVFWKAAMIVFIYMSLIVFAPRIFHRILG